MAGSDPTVFISYASEDAPAAQRLSGALRAAGVAVWFDQNELRGGDAWDQSIRQRIHDCTLFIPLISAHSENRKEGYFRREWRLAADRTHDMSERAAFLLPVVIDATTEKGADVPDSFLRVQWTRLTAGEESAAFCDRIKALLASGRDTPAPSQHGIHGASPALAALRPSSRIRPWMIVVIAAIAGAVALAWQKNRSSASHSIAPKVATPVDAGIVATFTPPPHSIAVLPFVNMSGDKEQQYFSDGLTEELLNSLARVNELQVAARTSSFSFEGEHPDIVTVAHKLNVGAVLEGSVRRSGHTVRITAQLVNGVTGFHLWSQAYDRDLGDVLKLQTEIANHVASALKVTLLGDVAAKVELGGTRNAAAFDAYLRASKLYLRAQTDEELQAAIAGYSEAIRLDPGYALAYAYRSAALGNYARNWAKGPGLAEYRLRMRSDAKQAVALAPSLAEAHVNLANAQAGELEFADAAQEFERALALGSGNASVLRDYGEFAVEMGQVSPALAAVRRSVQLDPLNPQAHFALGSVLSTARRNDEALRAFRDALALAPNDGYFNAWLGFAYYWGGDPARAVEPCQRADAGNKPLCLALAYWKLGRQQEAQDLLAGMQREWGDDGAVFYAIIYAERGDKAHALESLERAMRIRQPYLIKIKTAESFDLLRNEPRFQAIVKQLKFPT